MKPLRVLALFFAIIFGLSSLAGVAGDGPQPTGSVAGNWLGTLTVGGIKLRIVFHISKSDAGWTASIDSPDQGATGLRVDHVDWSDGTVTIVSNQIKGQFSGRPSPDGTQLTGTWTQGALALPLALHRVDHVDGPPARPQTPQRPFPYSEENVTFDDAVAGVTLAGTLTFPKSGGAHPAILLIAGSGPQGRDEVVAGHRVFLVLSDYLTRRGWMVLRYDKRGIGGSNGNYATATTADFANDARAAFAYLRGRKDVDPRRVGLVGHSEGGLIAPIVASTDKSVAFIVLIGGPGVTGEKILLAQSEAIGRANGKSEAVLARRKQEAEQVYALLESETDLGRLKTKLTALYDRQFGDNPDERALVTAQMDALLSPWFRYFLIFDPKSVLQQVSCPVLALNGALDLQVPAGQNLPMIEAALRSGGNRDFTTQELPGLNHLLQPAKTGSPSEYSVIEQTMAPAALAIIADWITKHSSATNVPR